MEYIIISLDCCTFIMGGEESVSRHNQQFPAILGFEVFRTRKVDSKNTRGPGPEGMPECGVSVVDIGALVPSGLAGAVDTL